METPAVYSLAVVWLALFGDYVLLTIAVPIFPLLGKSDTLTGLLFSAKAICQILSSPIVARYIDAYELEPLVFGLVVEALSCIIFSATKSYGAWFFARALSGVSSSLIISTGFLHIQRRHAGDDNVLGLKMSWVATGIIMGVTIGPPLGGVLYSVSAPLPFLLLICYLLVVALLACRLQKLRYGVYLVSSLQVLEGGSRGAVEPAAVVKAKVRGLLNDRKIVAPLLALCSANAAISCLEATFGSYMIETFHKDATTIGLMYIITAVPSVIGSKLGGPLGNRFGRWRICLIGMVLQGFFFALGPKTNFKAEAVSMFGAGLGMGLVDGVTPAMLGQRAAEAHGSTGIVYTLSTVAVQSGFIIGPIFGSGMKELFGFQTMSIILGVGMICISPVLLTNRGAGGKAKATVVRDDDEAFEVGGGSADVKATNGGPQKMQKMQSLGRASLDDSDEESFPVAKAKSPQKTQQRRDNDDDGDDGFEVGAPRASAPIRMQSLDLDDEI